MEKLYIKEIETGEVKKHKTVREFLVWYYLGKNKDNPYHQTKATYLENSKFNVIHCYPGKLRSFDDMLSIVKTYYNLITPKKLMHYLLTLEIEQGIYKHHIHFYNCSTMNRIRTKTTYVASDNYTSMVGIKYAHLISVNKFYSKYSWKDLLDMLDIKNQEDLDNYLKNNKYESLKIE